MGFLDGLSSLASGGLTALKNTGSGILDNLLPPEMTNTPGANLGHVPLAGPQSVVSQIDPTSGARTAGTDPGNQRAAAPSMFQAAAGQQLQGMPDLQQHGLLDRMGTADDRGMNFGDKLFAMGQILQGDMGGAADFMHQQRASNDVLQQRALQQKIAQGGLDALRNNMRDDGSLDLKGYLRDMPAGGDPTQGLGLAEDQRPKFTPMSIGDGGLASFDPRHGTATTVVQPTPTLNPAIRDAKGNVVGNPAYLQFHRQLSQDEAAGKRAGAPPIGRGNAANRALAGIDTATLKNALTQR
jgi:hypothetical protein